MRSSRSKTRMTGLCALSTLKQATNIPTLQPSSNCPSEDLSCLDFRWYEELTQISIKDQDIDFFSDSIKSQENNILSLPKPNTKSIQPIVRELKTVDVNNLTFSHNSSRMAEQRPMPDLNFMLNETVHEQEESDTFQTMRTIKDVKPEPKSHIQHINIVCDECRQTPIIGFRYKSVLLQDFDLCERCSHLSKYDTHTFIQIRYDNNQERKKFWSPMKWTRMVQTFRDNLEGDGLKIRLAIDKLTKIFAQDDKDQIENFVSSGYHQEFDELCLAYIKKFHS